MRHGVPLYQMFLLCAIFFRLKLLLILGDWTSLGRSDQRRCAVMARKSGVKTHKDPKDPDPPQLNQSASVYYRGFTHGRFEEDGHELKFPFPGPLP